MNGNFLVSVSHHLALIMSLALVHTAGLYYRLNIFMRLSDWLSIGFRFLADVAEKMPELDYLEEIKVVNKVALR
ncbi:hypothetical protein JTE90_026348 [Oedothorax gibbosus]|uniref:Uncharacterized protein n=1 Tax=Oedothorax gibbosus TaxID=931172 RepID=A0AAV6THR7_9ARAC|nr:hypothetical protein JTE90_026348 [Oedothorax gibbosus]